MAENQTDSIIQTIRLLQKLRASVGNVFQKLSDGCSVTEGNEKQILNSFHESLLTVNNDFSELEKVSNTLQTLSAVTPNSIYLSIDPAIDKSLVYTQVLQSYKWSNKVSELASYGVDILDQHVKLKRSQPVGTQQNKRTRRLPPTGHAIPDRAVDLFVTQFSHLKAPDLPLVVVRPLGSHAVLQITLGHILKAYVALRGLMIEWVNVRGYTETNSDESKLELWTKSKYKVFRKVTESATAATLHFYSPHNAELSLTSFLLWFKKYKTLFSAPCQKCGKHYLNGLPPTWRDLRLTQPYHDVCRQ